MFATGIVSWIYCTSMLNSVCHWYRFLDLLYINVEFSLPLVSFLGFIVHQCWIQFATGIVSWIYCTSMLNSAYLPLFITLVTLLTTQLTVYIKRFLPLNWKATPNLFSIYLSMYHNCWISPFLKLWIIYSGI